MEGEVFKEELNTRDELVARIMNSAAVIKQEQQDDLRRATRTVAKRVEMCTEVYGGSYVYWTVHHLYSCVKRKNQLDATYFII